MGCLGLKASLDLLANQASRDRTACRVHQANQELKVIQDTQEVLPPRVQLDRKEVWEARVFQDIQVAKVILVLLVFLALLGVLVSLVQKEIKVSLNFQVWDLQVSLDQREILDHLVFRDHLEQRAVLVTLAVLAFREA